MRFTVQFPSFCRFALGLLLAGCVGLPPASFPAANPANSPPTTDGGMPRGTPVQSSGQPSRSATEATAGGQPLVTSSGRAPARLALLLPITSSAEARTIRDGFQFALEQMPEGARPRLQVYDTSKSAAIEQLAAARTDGNNFVVGPLLRNEVAAVAASGAVPLPTLALNALAGDARAPANFYQFALSPEDEARAIAQRILADGFKRGVALTPSGEWGSRVATAFSQEFRAGGGSLLAQANYDTAAADYSAGIKQVLGLNDSDARLRRLQSITGARFDFEPRRRSDIQFIFAAASQPTHARLLRPQISFQYAGDIPTYMTSPSFTPGGKEANDDLNGVMLPGMPWLLPDASLDALRGAVQQDSANTSWQSQYFAFGFDAAQLALSIAVAGRDTARVRMIGLTGKLSLDTTGHVRREQTWVRMRDGEAQLITTSTRN